MGLLPFWGAVVMQWQQWQWSSITGAALFLVYSAVILSFMAGASWGHLQARVVADELYSSLRGSILLVTNALALCCAAVLLLGLFFYDSLVIGIMLLAAGYCWLTNLVVLSHLLMLIVL